MGGKEQLLRRLCRGAVSEDAGWWMPHPYHRFATRLRVVATPGEEPKTELATV